MDLNFGLPAAIEVNEPNITTLNNTKINTLCHTGILRDKTACHTMVNIPNDSGQN